jgi:hypothetical protein
VYNEDFITADYNKSIQVLILTILIPFLCFFHSFKVMSVFQKDNRVVKEKMKQFQERPSTTITYLLHYGMNVIDFDRVVNECYERAQKMNLPDPDNIFKNFQPKSQQTDQQLLPKKKEKAKVKMGLISLHGCGDLSCIAIDLFCKWENAQTLVAVSCCYNKLVEERNQSS